MPSFREGARSLLTEQAVCARERGEAGHVKTLAGPADVNMSLETLHLWGHDVPSPIGVAAARCRAPDHGLGAHFSQLNEL